MIADSEVASYNIFAELQHHASVALTEQYDWQSEVF